MSVTVEMPNTGDPLNFPIVGILSLLPSEKD